ncbi:ActD-like protein [Corallococcus macrosporus]|uniref:ActD-like protein n=1 Tax=Corallococcus macrosporus DSM 14697 TaxID=1189310 RepID=A0A250JLB9_9BACT|nr:ActD-like protein [Corallococcus macrosporus]ATB44679.1 ActD-like protein [Corallococcus macrosporus DSM 14697]
MTSPHRTPDWLLERIALGELPPGELAAARARLAEEPDGLARLAALEADSRATLETLPPARVAREVEARAARPDAARPFFRRSPAWGLVPALAVAALFVVLRPSGQVETGVAPGNGPEVTRIKGLAPRLVVHRQAAAARPERLADGAAAAAGDVVQVGYVAAGREYGVIVSLDGNGAVTLHAPEEGAQAMPLAPSGTHALPRAYELDDAPYFERFIFVSAHAPFDVAVVLAAAQALSGKPDASSAPLVLPGNLTQVSLTLEKQE